MTAYTTAHQQLLPLKLTTKSPLPLVVNQLANPRSSSVVVTPLETYSDNSTMPSNGWKTVGQVLLASLIGIPVGLATGEWAWRSRPHTLAKKLEENKKNFLNMVKTPLTEDQAENVGKMGGLASTYNELVGLSRKNNEPLKLEPPNASRKEVDFTQEVGTLLQTMEGDALKLYELEQALETFEPLLKGEAEAGTKVLKNGLVVKEEAPRGILTWLRKSENDLLKIELAGHLAKAAKQSKVIAGAVAGGFIGAGVVLLKVWQKQSAEHQLQLALQQKQLQMVTHANFLKLPADEARRSEGGEQSNTQPVFPTSKKPQKTIVVPHRETVQDLWEKGLAK